MELFVCIYSLIFNRWWKFSPCDKLMCTNKTCFAGDEAENHILNQNLFSFISMRIKKIKIFPSADQTSIPGVNPVFPVLEWNLIFVLLSKILDWLKRLFVVQIPRVTVYREMRNMFVSSFSLALWRSRNEGDLFGSSKIDADKSCNQLLKIVMHRTPSRGIVWKDFSIFEGIRKVVPWT